MIWWIVVLVAPVLVSAAVVARSRRTGGSKGVDAGAVRRRQRETKPGEYTGLGGWGAR